MGYVRGARLMRVQIKGTTIFGYVRGDIKDLKRTRVDFLDEETNEIIKVKVTQLRETYQKERLT
jgi:hypothetical protein